MTRLAMLRHGETQWSRDGRIQGRTDVPLNEAGRAVLRLHRLPDEFARMRVVTSPLKRCVQTAHALGLPSPALEARLAEMSWGQWEGRTLRDLRFELGEAMVANESLGLDFTPLHGESPRQVLSRVSDWLREIAAAGSETLAVSHRGVIRVVFAAACGWDMRGRPPAKLDWTALQVFRLDHAGRPSVLSLNLPLVPVQSVASRK